MAETVIEQANEKRKLIVTTNNLGASNVYKEGASAPMVVSQNTQLSKTDIKPAVKYVPQKESFGSKLKKAIFGTEHIDNIPEYLVLKVAVPALKATFYDMFCAGLGMAFGMERKGGSKNGGYTGYFRSGSSSRDRDEEDDFDERRPNSYRDIGFLTESDANEVYDVMLDYVRDQGYCTVLEFYGIADREDPNRRRDDRMGWDKDDLRNPRIFKSRGRWYIDLPRPTHLDNMR